MDGIGWVVLGAALVFLAWAIVKRVFKYVFLGGLLIVGAFALFYLVNQ